MKKVLNGYGKPIKSYNLDGIDLARISRAERSIEVAMRRLMAMERSPMWGTARGDAAAHRLLLGMSNPLESINRQHKKAIRRKR
jgi:hypothetical protein